MKYMLLALLICGSSTAYAQQNDTRVARPGCIGSNCVITQTNRPGAYLRSTPATTPKNSTKTNTRCFVNQNGQRVCQ